MNTHSEIPPILLLIIPELLKKAKSIPHSAHSISDSLHNAYTQLIQGNNISLEDFDVLDLTTIFEKYLKESDPILSPEIQLKFFKYEEEQTEFLDLGTSLDSLNDRNHKLEEIVKNIPVPNVYQLDYIIYFAVDLFHQNMNTLNPITLARYLAPLLFLNATIELKKTELLVRAVKELIIYYDEVFKNITYSQKSSRAALNPDIIKRFKIPDQLSTHIKEVSTGVKVLCLDGGGIRGLVLVKILCILSEKLFGNSDDDGTRKLLACFDLVCGTSTGGILAVALASGYSLKRTRESYFELARLIFRPAYRIFSPSYRSLRYLYNGNYYDSNLLKTHFTNDFGSKDFQNIQNPVFLTATDATTDFWKTSLIRNYDNPRSPFPSLPDVTIPDALRITSAAPTYFAPVFMGDKTYLDGGVITNNPTELAIFESHHQWPDRYIEMILSLGTGTPEEGKGNVNLIGLVNGFVNIATCSEQIHLRVEDCILLLQPRPFYFRFSPPGVGSIALDESDENVLLNMEKKTEEYIESNKNDIDL